MSICKDCLSVDICKDNLIKAMKGLGLSNEQEIIETGLNNTACEYFKDRSKFIELPCKVGDTVYEITFRKKDGEYKNAIVKREISKIEIERNGIIGFRCNGSTWLPAGADYVCFTLEEAEKELRRRETDGE